MSYLSTDDDNRIILKSFGNYENDYINASHIDVNLIHYFLYNIDIVYIQIGLPLCQKFLAIQGRTVY